MRQTLRDITGADNLHRNIDLQSNAKLKGGFMEQEIMETHDVDEDGNPAGGHTTGRGLSISWQKGALVVDGKRIEPNGAFVEGAIAAAIGRLKWYQTTKFGCRENALAITKLEEGLHWLQHRTKDREKRGVEGTHQE